MLGQVPRIIRSMGSVAEIALSQLDRFMNFPPLETLLLLHVTGETKFAAGSAETIGVIGPVRIMTARALPLGSGGMDSLAGEITFQIVMAGQAECFLVLHQHRPDVAPMRPMTIDAALCRRRMWTSFFQVDFEFAMATEAELRTL